MLLQEQQQLQWQHHYEMLQNQQQYQLGRIADIDDSGMRISGNKIMNARMIIVSKMSSIIISIWYFINTSRKVCMCLLLMVGTCYSAVSPRNLPYVEYNIQFYNNIKSCALVILPPLLGYTWIIIDWNQLQYYFHDNLSSISNKKSASSGSNNVSTTTKNDSGISTAIHIMIHSFYTSFIYGYIWVFVLEIIWTTILRLIVFLMFEPNNMFGIDINASSFSWSGLVGVGGEIMNKIMSNNDNNGSSSTSSMPPLFVLPWVLREYKYRPKRITLLVADIVTSCVACPIIEEFIKLRLLQWTMPLSK